MNVPGEIILSDVRHRLTIQEKAELVRLVDAGMLPAAIRDEMNISLHSAQYWRAKALRGDVPIEHHLQIKREMPAPNCVPGVTLGQLMGRR